MAEQRYDFRKRLETTHFPLNLVDRKPFEDEISLLGGVEFIGGEGVVIENAKKDFNEFLRVALGIDVDSAKKSEHGSVKINIVLSHEWLEDVCAYKGRITYVANDGVHIRAFDERGAAQAIYDLEDLVKANMAPYLKKGKYKNKPLFSPRMVHSAYDLDVYPDGYLQNLAREGVDAILLFTCAPNQNRLGFVDFNDIIDRAEKYGIDVYAYSYLKNFNSPEAENAEEIYDSIYGPVFKTSNKLKGIVFVGESVEFPSSDERTTARHYYDNGPDNIPDGKPSPGWWPSRDYPKWLNLVKNTIRKYKPDADIVFWTYNWGWAPKKERIELLEQLPTDISLLVTFEMFQKYDVDGIQEMVCDYSLAFEGPGDYFVSEAEIAKKRGIRLYSMTNTGGRTWDFGVLPYEPFPMQWQRRFQAMRECNEKYGLTGLMECHHYGYTPSFITDFAKKSFEYSAQPLDYILRSIVDTFSSGETDKCLSAFNLWSDAIRRYPANDEEQYCVMRISTAYPLFLNKIIKIPRLDDDKVMFGGGISETDYKDFDKGRYTPHALRIRPEIKLFEDLIKKIQKGIKILESIHNPTETLKKIINMGKFIVCTYTTNVHVKKMFLVRQKLKIAESREEMLDLLNQARELGYAEIENAKKSIPLVEYDSAIGYEVSMGYACDKAHIEWKIRQVQFMIEKEIAMYENYFNPEEDKLIFLR